MEKIAAMSAVNDSRRENLPLTSTTESGLQSGEDHQAPEVYLAIPKDSEGLSGLNHFSRNLTGDGDLPGFGECDIYQIVHSRLLWIEKTKNIYNLSEARVRNDIFPVIRTKFGDWIVVNKHVEVEGILTKTLSPATGPLTGATFGFARLVEWSKKSDDSDVPDEWKLTNRELRFINRSISIKGEPGTFGSFRKLGGEFRPSLDCGVSEEGVNAIVEIFSDTYGGFTYGG